MKLLVLLAAFTVPLLADAAMTDDGIITGNDLVEMATPFDRVADRLLSLETWPDEPSEQDVADVALGLMFVAYVRGVADVYNGYGFCPPERGATGMQAAKIVSKFMKEYPEYLHEEGDTVAVWALAQAFPCEDSDDDLPTLLERAPLQQG